MQLGNFYTITTPWDEPRLFDSFDEIVAMYKWLLEN